MLILVALLLCGAAIAVAVTEGGDGDGGGPATGAAEAAAPRAARAPSRPAALPGGGRSILPEHRVVAHYGAPQARELGILGIGTPTEAGRRLRRQARTYAGPRRRPVMPAMELLAVIVTAAPGEGGLHRVRQPRAVIRRYLAAARRSGALLILDIQPGRATFPREARVLAEFLVEPDVGLALDPEWRMGPGEVPGRTIGSVDAREVNAVSAWLSRLVRRRGLPDKLLIVHQFADGMIRDRGRLRARPGLDIVLNADGFGSARAKTGTYHRVARGRGDMGTGVKLFIEEDSGLMTPGQVLGLRPAPDVVVYE